MRAARHSEQQHRAKKLAEVERAIQAIVKMVEHGAEPATVMPRLKALEAERARLQELRVEAEPKVIELHPGVADRYRQIVHELRAALAERTQERKAEVIAAVRSLVDRLVVYPHNDPQDPRSGACRPTRRNAGRRGQAAQWYGEIGSGGGI